MLFWLGLLPVFAQDFGDAFEEGTSRELNNAEQAEMELIFKLERCKETPQTQECQEFFILYGEELGVDLDQYVLPQNSDDFDVDSDQYVLPEQLSFDEFMIEEPVETSTEKHLNIDSIETLRKSSMMMGGALLLYGGTVLSYNKFMENPTLGTFYVNRTVHAGGLVLTTAAVGLLVKGWLTREAS